MIQAPVGFQCPECVHESAKRSPVVSARQIGSTRPVVTMTLIAVNVVAFLVTSASALAGGQSGLTQAQGDLVAQGWLVGAEVTRFGTVVGGVADGELYRLVTGGFLHAGVLHLAFNMWVLWVLGSQLEPALGRVRYAALYVTSLLAGSLGVMLTDPLAATVGASGAVFGLMGAAFALQHARGINPWRSGVGGLILLNVLITFAVPGISIGGHLGGLIGGALTGWTLVQLERVTRSDVAALALCAAFSVVFVLASVWAADRWYDPVLGFF
jgi:membrane associated rhomboid family serine protease